MIISSNPSPRIVSFRKLEEQGFRRRKPPLVLLAIDPSGEGRDRTGLLIGERHELELGEPHDQKYAVEHAFMIRHAERLDRDMEFPDVMSLLLAYHKKLCDLPKTNSGHRFVIENNGVGYPFTSMLRKLVGVDEVRGGSFVLPIITTTSNDDYPFTDEGKPRMPRMAGLDLFRTMLQLQRVMIGERCKGGDLLVSEMRTFIQTGKRPEAAEGAFDDLVMAGAVLIWAGVRLLAPTAKATRFH